MGQTYDEYMNETDEMEQKIIDALGTDGALTEVLKALSTDEKRDIFQYIIRMHDLNYDPDGGEAET